MTEQISPETIVRIILVLKKKGEDYADKFVVPSPATRGRVKKAQNNAYIVGIRRGISMAINTMIDNMPAGLPLLNFFRSSDIKDIEKEKDEQIGKFSTLTELISRRKTQPTKITKQTKIKGPKKQKEKEKAEKKEKEK